MPSNYPTSIDVDPKIALLRSLINYQNIFRAVVMVSDQEILQTFRLRSQNGFRFIRVFNAKPTRGISIVSLENGKPGSSLFPKKRKWVDLEMITAPIIHFDMPLNIGRIEQRIGRMDRIGERTTSTVLYYSL